MFFKLAFGTGELKSTVSLLGPQSDTTCKNNFSVSYLTFICNYCYLFCENVLNMEYLREDEILEI